MIKQIHSARGSHLDAGTIPTGLHPSAQGWPRQRTTLGQPSIIFSDPNGVASTRHNTFVRCLKNRLFSSPSPRPSPSGRGRTVRRISRKSATGFAGHISAKIGTPHRCPLSSRERVRVRGKQPLTFPIPSYLNGVAFSRHNTFAMCLKNRAPCSPSPRPSPPGRGRTIRRFSRKSATGFAGCIFARIGMPDCCPLSSGERVRVRGKQPSK